MRRLQTADLEGLLDILGEAYAEGGPLPFTTELLERLAALMRSEFATFIDLDLLHRVGRSYIGCSWDPYLPDGQMTEPYWDELERRPRLIHPTGVAKSSDVSGRPFSGPLHEEQIKLHGIRDEMWIVLDPSPTEYVVLYFESVDRRFEERDRLVALTLKPHVATLDRHAHARRRLSALLLALQRGDGEEEQGGLVLLGRSGAVEHMSPLTRRLVERWFGRMDGSRLPREVTDWLQSRSPRSPLELMRDNRRLVVEAPSDDALLLTEEALPPVPLTVRELDVLRCVAAGKSTAETARLLWIAPATVSKHLEHVYAKLGVTSRTAALARLGMTREAA